MKKLTEKELRNKFSKVCSDDKIVDINIYEDGLQADVITVTKYHLIISHSIIVKSDDELSVNISIMSSNKGLSWVKLTRS